MSTDAITTDPKIVTELPVRPATEKAVVTSPEPPRATHVVYWPFSGDNVTKLTAVLPEDQREALRWLHRYAGSQRLTVSAIAEMLTKDDGNPYSADTINQAFSGKRTAEGVSLAPLSIAILRLKKRVMETASSGPTTFIETPITRRIHQICAACYKKKRIGFIFSDSQLGKTTGLYEYARTHNHGSTVVIRVSAGSGLHSFVRHLAKYFRIPIHLGIVDLRERIIEAIDENMLLIIDEAHQFLIGGKKSNQRLIPFEFIREIYDRCKCGVILVGTEALKTSLREEKILDQLWRRRSPGNVMQLPQEVPVPDLNAFAAHFGLDPAPKRILRITVPIIGLDGERKELEYSDNPFDLQTTIVRRDSLGLWLKLLDDAKDLAESKGKPFTWFWVLTQYCIATADAKDL